MVTAEEMRAPGKRPKTPFWVLWLSASTNLRGWAMWGGIAFLPIVVWLGLTDANSRGVDAGETAVLMGVFFAGVGFGVGITQAILLRRTFGLRQMARLMWLLASYLGFGMTGLVFGFEYPMGGYGKIMAPLIDPSVLSKEVVMILGAVIIGAMVGTLQWAALHKVVPNAHWWVPANTAAYTIAVAIVLVITIPLRVVEIPVPFGLLLVPMITGIVLSMWLGEDIAIRDVWSLFVGLFFAMRRLLMYGAKVLAGFMVLAAGFYLLVTGLSGNSNVIRALFVSAIPVAAITAVATRFPPGPRTFRPPILWYRGDIFLWPLLAAIRTAGAARLSLVKAFLSGLLGYLVGGGLVLLWFRAETLRKVNPTGFQGFVPVLAILVAVTAMLGLAGGLYLGAMYWPGQRDS